MLAIKAIMNSSVADIFAFKTCCGVRAYDQNLEILISNQSDQEVTVLSYCDLVTDQGPQRISTLMPHGPQSIVPWATIAFYCSMEEERWAQVRQILVYDITGRHYAADV